MTNAQTHGCRDKHEFIGPSLLGVQQEKARENEQPIISSILELPTPHNQRLFIRINSKIIFKNKAVTQHKLENNLTSYHCWNPPLPLPPPPYKRES